MSDCAIYAQKGAYIALRIRLSFFFSLCKHSIVQIGELAEGGSVYVSVGVSDKWYLEQHSLGKCNERKLVSELGILAQKCKIFFAQEKK